ncbi:MAG TPA: TerC/Alx family metal homeostasis membrane protein [Candidatus Krumholzibacteria bacterium]|nr:TerC/Alx family metal homeostasis membrane protein [Candidatus Krumholzibacteria bacterium]
MPVVWQWIAFHALLAAALWVDLGVVHRRPEAVSTRRALSWVGVWVALAFLFALGINFIRGHHTAATFITGYVVELSLSVDNLFVFYLIFQYFHVPREFEHRILFWGIIGALITRLGFILTGVALLHRFEWLTWVLGSFLVITAVRMMFSGERQVHPERNPVFKLLRPFMGTPSYDSGRFFMREGGRLLITPALVVLLVIETTDIVFAVDSVPAILAITTDPFIVYTSNALAILGLRSLYTVIGRLIVTFEFLHHGLSVILAFIGVKMLISEWYTIPVGITLGVVLAVLASALLFSMWARRGTSRRDD